MGRLYHTFLVYKQKGYSLQTRTENTITTSTRYTKKIKEEGKNGEGDVGFRFSSSGGDSPGDGGQNPGGRRGDVLTDRAISMCGSDDVIFAAFTDVLRKAERAEAMLLWVHEEP